MAEPIDHMHAHEHTLLIHTNAHMHSYAANIHIYTHQAEEMASAGGRGCTERD